MTSGPERIGVFGGTFDPIHNAHLAMARAALVHARLDRVLFVISARPPHKSEGPYATPEERFDMVEAALFDERQMEACRVEMDRSGPSYMADTLAALHGQHPEAALFLMIGMDSLVDLPQWRNHTAILRLARLLVIPRPGDWSVPRAVNGCYAIVPFQETPISSTEIRSHIAAGDLGRDIVPERVLRLIRERGIYNAAVSDSPR